MPVFHESTDPFGIVDGYAPEVPYNNNTTDETLVQHIMNFFHDAQDARLVYERQWELYRLYIKGEQLLYRDVSTNELVRVADFDSKRLFSLNNQCRPAARSLIGKMARLIPTFTTVPATSTQDQLHGARVADAFFNYFRRKQALTIKYIDVQRALTWAGTGIMQLDWDPLAGREFSYCDPCGFMGEKELQGAVCPACDAAELEQAYEGDMRCIVRDPRDVFVEPGIVDPMEARYIVVRIATPVTEIRRRFPAMGTHVKAETGIYAERTARLTYSTITGNWGMEFMKDHAYLYEYYEKPTETYPDGRVVYMSNNKILEEKPGNYRKFGRLPFFFNFWERNPGEFWGESPMVQAWTRQKELNQLETQFREHTELLARAKVLIPAGTRIPSDEINATTGQIIKYNRLAGKPEYMPPPEMPAVAYNRQQQLINDIRLQFAVTEQEMGVMSSDPNGRAMAILAAEADQTVGPILTQNIHEWKEFYRCLLIMARYYYHPDRQFVIAGSEGMETYSFRDLDLEEGWDLELEVEDGLARNQVIRVQQGMELANMGAFTNPATGQLDIARFAKVAKIKIPGIGEDINSSEYSAAMGLIKKLEDGEQVQPMPFDDPVIFSEVLLAWLRGAGRAAAPQLVQQIMQVWQYYTMWASQGAPGEDQTAFAGQQGPSQPGQSTSAPGGTPSNPSMGGTGAQAATSEAQQTTQAADALGEQASRTTLKHES